MKELAKHLPFEFITLNETPDGTFPNGVPNPLLLPNREATAKVVRESGADLGIAWDGDFDRCFLFDEKADFIEGYYIVGLLAEVSCTRSRVQRLCSTRALPGTPKLFCSVTAVCLYAARAVMPL